MLYRTESPFLQCCRPFSVTLTLCRTEAPCCGDCSVAASVLQTRQPWVVKLRPSWPSPLCQSLHLQQQQHKHKQQQHLPCRASRFRSPAALPRMQSYRDGARKTALYAGALRACCSLLHSCLAVRTMPLACSGSTSLRAVTGLASSSGWPAVPQDRPMPSRGWLAHLWVIQYFAVLGVVDDDEARAPAGCNIGLKRSPE